jgi:hypothetical protein
LLSKVENGKMKKSALNSQPADGGMARTEKYYCEGVELKHRLVAENIQ